MFLNPTARVPVAIQPRARRNCQITSDRSPSLASWRQHSCRGRRAVLEWIDGNVRLPKATLAVLISISNSEPLDSQGLKVVCVQCFFRNYFRHSHEQKSLTLHRCNPAGRVQRTSSNLRGRGETFRQRTKPSHGGRLTSAGAPKQCFPRAAERDTAPAIRTDRTAALHNPLQKITAFNDSNPVGQIDQGGICVAAFGPPAREDRVRNRFRRPDGAW